jgi:pimeloyl-ACP methyl ester carboxylesterase
MTAPIRLQTSVWNPLGERRALLIHGLSSDGGSWWRVASELADDGWMVAAPDLRSHGRSPTAVDHRVVTMAADVAQLGDGWDLIVGHSLGGSIAAVLAADRHVPATVLIDPVLVLRESEREPLRAGVKASLDQDAAMIRAGNPTWSERDVQRKVLALAAFTPDVVDAILDDNEPWDVRWAIPRWAGRVHLLAADPELGALLSPADIDEVTRAAGDRVTASVVHGAGHSLHRERPEVVGEAIRALTRSR